MSALSVQPPFPIFTGTDGLPLEDGYIWVGTANLNPITNPIIVYWDAASTQAASQPIRTLGGYPVYQGTPARFFVGADYSIQVQDKNGNVVYTSLNDNAFANKGGTIATNATGTGSQTVFNIPSIPVAIYINGVYQNQNTYTVANGSITFSEAPPVTSIIEFVF